MIAAAVVTGSPALPVVWEWLLLTSVVLGIACTVPAFRLVSKGIMRTRGGRSACCS